MMERIECRRRIKWFTVCMIREPVSLCTGYGLHSIAVCMGMIAYTIESMGVSCAEKIGPSVA